jgi:hypothetical protein
MMVYEREPNMDVSVETIPYFGNQIRLVAAWFWFGLVFVEVFPTIIGYYVLLCSRDIGVIFFSFRFIDWNRYAKSLMFLFDER